VDIQESIRQLMHEEEEVIGHRFYEIFFQRCPQAKPFFDGVDMHGQAHVLTMALLIIEQMHTNLYGATRMYLRYTGAKHFRMGIPEEMYAQWRDAMLETLKNSLGDGWSDELADEWRTTLDCAIELLLDGYETHSGVS